MSIVDPYLVQRTDTARLSGAEPTDFWAEHVCVNHGTLGFRFSDPATFRGGTVVQRYVDHQLVDFWSEGITYTRRAADARRDDDESMRLVVPIAGSLALRQDDVSAVIGPGQAAATTKARPFDLSHAGPARAWVMNLPPHTLPTDPLGPSVLDVRRGVGSVVASMIAALGRQASAVDGPAFAASSQAIIELLALCVRPRGQLPDTLSRVDEAVRDFVRRHASDPQVTPASIARDLGWSVRQIQLALQGSGTTPSRLLRDTRLEHARRHLSTSPRDRTIADIAHASGFRALSTFGAAFKERYGITPQEARP